jgi:hypothetical protein
LGVCISAADLAIQLIRTILSSLEHWKGLQKSAKESKKQLKQAAHDFVHPKKAREEKQKTEVEAEEEENARSDHEGAQHAQPVSTASSLLKPDNVKDKVLRERVEGMRKRQEQEDEEWKSGSQWRWEIITGRAQKAMKEKEQKWKLAMESVAPSDSKSKAEAGPGKEGLLHQTKTVDPEATSVRKEVAPSTSFTRAGSAYASDSAAPQARPREPGSEVPRVETLPKGENPGTPKGLPPSYDNYEAVTLAEKSLLT